MKVPYQKKEYTLVPEGTFLARVIRIVYEGTQPRSWKGQDIEPLPKIWVTFELPTELNQFKEGEEAKPFVISAEYTHSMGKKSKLRPITESIIGTQLKDEEAYNFDHDNILGQPCQITVKHIEKDDNIYANITAVSPLLKGVKCPAQVNQSSVLSFEKWNEELFNSLPKFIKEKIISSPEYKLMKGIDVKEADTSIPF